MPEIPRLNGVIKALEQGKTAFVGFAPVDVETATALAGSLYDGIAFEMEHAPLSPTRLRDALQYMLDRQQILQGGTLAPRVTPLVRIPPNGGEMNQWLAKQVLDIGVFGINLPPREHGRGGAECRERLPLPPAPRDAPLRSPGRPG